MTNTHTVGSTVSLDLVYQTFSVSNPVLNQTLDFVAPNPLDFWHAEKTLAVRWLLIRPETAQTQPAVCNGENTSFCSSFEHSNHAFSSSSTFELSVAKIIDFYQFQFI